MCVVLTRYISKKWLTFKMLMLFLQLMFAGSVDCSNLVDFARSLGVHLFNGTMYTNLQGNCCNAYGVTCSAGANGNVTNIAWPSSGIKVAWNGTVNSSISLPPYLLDLNLGGHDLVGSFKNLVLPSTIQIVNWNGNLLNDSLPNFPASVKYIRLQNNKHSGSIPTLPTGLIEFRLFNNRLTGSIPSLPSNLSQLVIYNNLLGGLLPEFYSSALTDITIHTNQFVGPIPRLPSTLIKFLLYGPLNAINGSVPTIPNTVTDLRINGLRLNGSLEVNTPSFLKIENNFISNLTIKNTTNLVVANCDISNNPLSNSTQALALTGICTKNNLYQSQLFTTQLKTTVLSTARSSWTTGELYTTSDTLAEEFVESTTRNNNFVVDLSTIPSISTAESYGFDETTTEYPNFEFNSTLEHTDNSTYGLFTSTLLNSNKDDTVALFGSVPVEAVLVTSVLVVVVLIILLFINLRIKSKKKKMINSMLQ